MQCFVYLKKLIADKHILIVAFSKNYKETYLEPSQATTMELFLWLNTLDELFEYVWTQKGYIADVPLGSKYTFIIIWILLNITN